MVEVVPPVLSEQRLGLNQDYYNVSLKYFLIEGGEFVPAVDDGRGVDLCDPLKNSLPKFGP
jgi:hypothetical protein